MYQIETFTICDGWVNTWTNDDKPEVFATYSDAVRALAEFYSDMAEDYEDGRMATPINPKEYRIVEVKNDL